LKKYFDYRVSMTVTSSSRSGAHVSLVFTVHSESDDPLEQGSYGVGLCLEAGLSTSCRSDSAPSTGVTVIINGNPSEDELQREVLDECIKLDPSLASMHHTFDIQSQLPFSQGFGLSAAGALSAARCLLAMSTLPLKDQDSAAWMIAHRVERKLSGGLGDITALHAGGVARRTNPGSPYHVRNQEIVLGPGISEGWGSPIPILAVWRKTNSRHTSEYIDSPHWSGKIREAGVVAMESLGKDEWNESRWSEIIQSSNDFADKSGLLDDASRRELLNEVRWALRSFEPRLSVLLCMLGESVVVVPNDMEDDGWIEHAEILIDRLTNFGFLSSRVGSIS
jgi:pantoate kinase